MSKLIREPLVHFLFVGVVIFAVYYYMNPDDGSSDGMQIRITSGDIDRFKQIFKKQWQRMPNEQEMQGLVRAHLKEEILYREALALGLEKDDTIVRRRLAQKMEFFITDITIPSDVDDKVLMTYYQKYPQRYSRAVKLTFRHIYFNPDQRKERLMDEASALLNTLKSTNAGMDVPEQYGDRFMFGTKYKLASINEIKREYGQDFSQQLEGLETGSWQGPIMSGYGVHLIYIAERKTASVYPLKEIRERVKNDYLFELRQTRNEAVLDKLKARYDIVIEET